MIRRRLIVVWMLMVPCAAPCNAVAAATTAHCPPAIEVESDAIALPHLAAVLKRGGTLDILAIGAGAPGSPVDPNAGALGQVTSALQAKARGLTVAIAPLGGRGRPVADQLALIQAALAKHRYQLVLWQTGTLEAVQNVPADGFYQTLADGADAITKAGADLVLVEPQYSRFLNANADIAPYLAAMETVGASPGVVVFHRYGLMHDWAEAGLIDLEQAASADRPAVAAKLHACLGAELARSLLVGATSEGK